MLKQLVLVAAMAASMSAMAQQQPAQGPQGNRPPPPERQQERAAPPVNRADFMARAAKHFDELDANKDGVISPDERRAFHESRRVEHHAASPGATGDSAQRPMRQQGPGPQTNQPGGAGVR